MSETCKNCRHYSPDVVPGLYHEDGTYHCREHNYNYKDPLVSCGQWSCLPAPSTPPRGPRPGDRYAPDPSSGDRWISLGGDVQVFDGKEWKEVEEEGTRDCALKDDPDTVFKIRSHTAEEYARIHEEEPMASMGTMKIKVDAGELKALVKEIKDAKESIEGFRGEMKSMIDDNGRFRYPAVEEVEGTEEAEAIIEIGPGKIHLLEPGETITNIEEEGMEPKMDMHYDVKTGETYAMVDGNKLIFHNVDSTEETAAKADADYMFDKKPCAKCGKGLVHNATFCGHCGVRVVSEVCNKYCTDCKHKTKVSSGYMGMSTRPVCGRPMKRTGLAILRSFHRERRWGILGRCGTAGRFWEGKEEA